MKKVILLIPLVMATAACETRSGNILGGAAIGAAVNDDNLSREFQPRKTGPAAPGALHRRALRSALWQLLNASYERKKGAHAGAPFSWPMSGGQMWITRS